MTVPLGHVPLTVAARIIGRAADALRREVHDGHLAALRTGPSAWMWIKPGDARALQAAGSVRCLPTPSGTIADTDPTDRGRGRPRGRNGGMIDPWGIGSSSVRTDTSWRDAGASAHTRS